MKKVFILIMMLFMGNFVLASEQDNVLKFFNSYVNAANTYSNSIPDFYAPNARIIRVVIKKDGTTASRTSDFARYKSEMIRNANLAKMRNYKNFYSDIKITRQGNDYKLSCMRKPSLSDYKIPAHFVIGKDARGNYKIKEESMHTKMQVILLFFRKVSCENFCCQALWILL